MYFLRGVRRKHYNPKYIPTKFLKQKWRDWKPRTIYTHVESQTDSNRNSRNINTSYNPTNTVSGGAGGAGGAGGVDRNTSIRSIITLPGYTPAPRASEQVLGREGERAGMDVVVEFPETGEEEETRREDQMESLYQIRLARRQEIAERERRRQERRDARAQGDWARLEELRLESRARAEADAANASQTNLSAQAMIAEHQSRGRDRRISSVSYASVGHVRHDGTRLRATSEDSERGPLLDSAAPMGGGATAGPTSLRSVFRHSRGRSASSALSMSTNASDERGDPTPPSTRDERSNSDPMTSPSLPRDTPADSDIGDSQIPHPLPPQYEQLEHEEAPPYESPIETRLPRLPSIRTLPSIEVSIASPTHSTPAAPASPVQRTMTHPRDGPNVS
jgi:hypothetical protein